MDKSQFSLFIAVSQEVETTTLFSETTKLQGEPFNQNVVIVLIFFLFFFPTGSPAVAKTIVTGSVPMFASYY